MKIPALEREFMDGDREMDRQTDRQTDRTDEANNNFFRKLKNIKFRENPCSGKRVYGWGQRNGQTNRETDRQTELTKRIITFCEN